MIGNYKFIIGKDEDFLNHKTLYTYIIIIQASDILLNFFKIEIIN